jgi:cytidylate kinase
MPTLAPAFIGIAGPIGAGKTTITQALAAATSWPIASFGNEVRRIATDRGIPITRDELQRLGQQLLEDDPAGFIGSVVQQTPRTADQGLLIDGIRHERVVTALRTLAAPHPFILLFLDANPEERIRHLRSRGDDHSLEDLARMDAHATERELPQVRAASTFVIDTRRPSDAVVADILGRIEEPLRNR